MFICEVYFKLSHFVIASAAKQSRSVTGYFFSTETQTTQSFTEKKRALLLLYLNNDYLKCTLYKQFFNL